MPRDNQYHVGVDWSSGSWLAVAYSDSGYEHTKVFEETTLTDESSASTGINRLWQTYSDSAKRIIIDVPIGLCESFSENNCCEDSEGKLSRGCDSLARSVVGPQYRSVFTPPARKAAHEAAVGKSHDTVNEINRKLTGKGLSTQSYAIAPGIAYVDALLEQNKDARAKIMEAHPEVCFRAFMGSKLQHAKKYASGHVERLRALENVGIDATERLYDIADEIPDTHEVKLDDALDAIALAVTSVVGGEELRSLPSDYPNDAKGLPMRMVYASDEPLID